MKIILIKLNGITRELPFVDGNPDFGGISEPTLTILQAAFVAGDHEIMEVEEEINIVE
jgi:hypothetical protein